MDSALTAFLIATFPGLLMALNELVDPDQEWLSKFLTAIFTVIWLSVFIIQTSPYLRGVI